MTDKVVHYWVIQVGDGDYGLLGFSDSSSAIYFGSYELELPFSAPVVASALLLIVLLLLFAAWHLIGNLRHKAAPGDE